MKQSLRLICIDEDALSFNQLRIVVSKVDAIRALDLRNMHSFTRATLDAMKAQSLMLHRGLYAQRRSSRLKVSKAFC